MKAADFVTRYEGLRQRLPGDAFRRAEAARTLAAIGLPGQADADGRERRREEAWHYTSLRALDSIEFFEPLVAVDGAANLAARLPQLDCPRVVFVDGRIRPDLCRVPDDAGFTVGGFADTPDFGTLPRPEREALVGLNTMLAEDGAIVTVPDGVDAGLLLIASLATDVHGRPVAFHPRHAIRLGAGARLAVLELSIGEGVYLHNPVSELVVGPNATLSHVRLQDEAATAFHLATLYADLAADATYDGFTLNLGARLTRTEIHARLGGPKATAHLNGAQLLRGRQHADFTSVIAHDAPSGASRQTVKNVLSGRSRGVFQGKIEVARVAQKTDGYQMSQALLLSPDAEVDSKPELQIYADDVKCSHGATVGALDAEQLFYLRSRGIPEEQARAMLVRAFLDEALEAIADDAMRAVLDHAIDAWWMREERAA